MSINLKKSAVLVVSRGKMTHSFGIQLGKLGTLTPIGETPYKYLGILQDFVVQSTEVKHQVLSEYYRRCRKELLSKYMESTSVLLLMHMLYQWFLTWVVLSNGL